MRAFTGTGDGRQEGSREQGTWAEIPTKRIQVRNKGREETGEEADRASGLSEL